jgi:hypothetical protein
MHCNLIIGLIHEYSVIWKLLFVAYLRNPKINIIFFDCSWFRHEVTDFFSDTVYRPKAFGWRRCTLSLLTFVYLFIHSLHSFIHYIHSFIHYIHSFITFIHSLHSFIHSFIYLLFICLCIHLFIHFLFIYSLIHSLFILLFIFYS